MTAPWLEQLQAIVRRYIDPQRYEWRPTVDPVPVGREQMVAVYGDPKPRWMNGRGFCDPAWESRNCLVVSATKIPGYSKRLYMHRLVAPHFREALRRARAACPDYEFRRIGCFCPRPQRYDPSRPWSDHAWAIAFDVNAEQNCSRTLSATDPRPFDVGWDQISDLPVGVVQAFESVGFEWGGRWRPWVDPMHFSLRRTG